MYFNKNDWVKMGGAAAIAAFALLVVQNFSGGNLYSFAKSEKISWTKALSLKENYRLFRPLRVNYKVGLKDTFARLNGFVFDATALDQILRNNVVGKPDSVIFYLGQDGTFWDHWKKHGVMHIIAAGMYKGKLLYPVKPTDYGDINKSTIYDKADPCPPNCPTNVPEK